MKIYRRWNNEDSLCKKIFYIIIVWHFILLFHHDIYIKIIGERQKNKEEIVRSMKVEVDRQVLRQCVKNISTYI